MDDMLEDLTGIWFDFMETNRTALDPTVSVGARYESALFCESLMASRYQLIEEIDTYFEGKFNNV